MQEEKSILIIYTGGTIGMMVNPDNGALSPLDFNQITNHLPELKRFNCDIDAISFDPPLDSSDIGPDIWINLVNIIQERYEDYHGFVILHGTDTMAYTASALSFMIENLKKPVVLTGSQIPLGVLRTDGKENIITSLEIASKNKGDHPVVPEVCIYFENKLFRGNRTHKHNAEYFNAFRSDNLSPLAEAGININYNYSLILKPDYTKSTIFHKYLDPSVTILKIFPGIQKSVIESIINAKGLKAIVLETFGEGNTFAQTWFIELLKNAIQNNIIILNISQCAAGKVDQGKYQNSKSLLDLGVINGHDLTTEAAITKFMFLFGNKYDREKVKELIGKPLRGELTA
ncbi:asparaginase [Bacteroidota bacterium]